MLIEWVNTLTAVLTLVTLVGYAVVYTMFLKHATPPRAPLSHFATAKLENGVELHRKPTRFVTPIFEEGGSRTEQRLWQRRVESVESGQKHEAVATSSGNGDRVELQIAEATDHVVARRSWSFAGARRKAGPSGLHEACPRER